MKYIELEVRTALIIHGYDSNNKEIEEVINEPDFVRKIISVKRIQSVTEKYLLVTSSHKRVMYWEYKGTLQDIKEKLASNGLMVE